MSRLRWGLRVAELGWPVFPLRGKYPLIKKWPTRATADPDQIKAWSREFPYMTGWGIVTAWDRCVFDVDLPAALTPELREMVENWPGPKVLTTKGTHIYGIAREGQRSRIRPVLGADIKAGGGFVLAPGSIHPKSGRCYVEVNPLSTPLVEFPPLLMDQLPKPFQQVPVSWSRKPIVLAPRCAIQALNAAERSIYRSSPGERNNTLYRAARFVEPYVTHHVIDARQTVECLQRAAVLVGLDAVEVRRTIYSAFARRER